MRSQGFRHVFDGPEGSEGILGVHAQLGHAKMNRLQPPKSCEEWKVATVKAIIVQEPTRLQTVAERADA